MTRDLTHSPQIHDLVYEAYDGWAAPQGPAIRFYEAGQLEALPAGLERWALGVGNPVLHAGLRPGERVIDLGCGAGIDVLLAADQVGPVGLALGVDFLPSMVDRGRHFAAEIGVTNARFVNGAIEDIPAVDESADVVISNGAINLSARKSRALAEAYRVLRPAGRLCVSDLTLADEELPAEILTHPSAWAG